MKDSNFVYVEVTKFLCFPLANTIVGDNFRLLFCLEDGTILHIAHII